LLKGVYFVVLRRCGNRERLALPGLAALQRLRHNYSNFIARQLYAQNNPKSRKIQYWRTVALHRCCTVVDLQTIKAAEESAGRKKCNSLHRFRDVIALYDDTVGRSATWQN